MADCLDASVLRMSAGRTAHREAWGHHPESRTARRARSRVDHGERVARRHGGW